MDMNGGRRSDATTISTTMTAASRNRKSSESAKGSTIATRSGNERPNWRHSNQSCARAAERKSARAEERVNVNRFAAPQSGTSPRRARLTADDAAAYASGTNGASRSSTVLSLALNCSAVKTTTSIDTSNPIAITMRIPRNAYGIHVRACVHASSDAANNAGQNFGTATPEGKMHAVLIANHSSVIE